MRHTNAGMAIPTFPLVFGHLVPPIWNAGVAIHFAHRVGALVVTILVLATVAHVFYRHQRDAELVRPSALLLGCVGVQIALGAFVVLSALQPMINTAHVATGALVLGTSVVLTFRTFRERFGEARQTSRRAADSRGRRMIGAEVRPWKQRRRARGHAGADARFRRAREAAPRTSSSWCRRWPAMRWRGATPRTSCVLAGTLLGTGARRGRRVGLQPGDRARASTRLMRRTRLRPLPAAAAARRMGRVRRRRLRRRPADPRAGANLLAAGVAFATLSPTWSSTPRSSASRRSRRSSARSPARFRRDRMGGRARARCPRAPGSSSASSSSGSSRTSWRSRGSIARTTRGRAIRCCR